MRGKHIRTLLFYSLFGFLLISCGNGGGGGDSALFQLAVSHATGMNPQAVTHGDFNGDGFQDLAVANQDDYSVTILLGNGSGSFPSSKTIQLATLSSPVAIARGRFNSDTIDDLAVANFGTDNVSIILGGGLFTVNGPYPVGVAPQGIAIGDFGGNSSDDLAVVNFISDSISILLGNGNGTFPTFPSQTITSGSFKGPFAIIKTPLDNDPLLDLALVNLSGNTLSTLLGLGGGNFTTPSVPIPVGSNPSALTIGDFNGDGKIDIAVANSQDLTLSILLGNGDGTFQPQSLESTGQTPFSVESADLDGDGKLDLVVANKNDNTLSILLGKGDGTFQPQVTLPTDQGPISVTLADLNGDNKVDITIANSGSNTVSVFLNAR